MLLVHYFIKSSQTILQEGSVVKTGTEAQPTKEPPILVENNKEEDKAAASKVLSVSAVSLTLKTVNFVVLLSPGSFSTQRIDYP